MSLSGGFSHWLFFFWLNSAASFPQPDTRTSVLSRGAFTLCVSFSLVEQCSLACKLYNFHFTDSYTRTRNLSSIDTGSKLHEEQWLMNQSTKQSAHGHNRHNNKTCLCPSYTKQYSVLNDQPKTHANQLRKLTNLKVHSTATAS